MRSLKRENAANSGTSAIIRANFGQPWTGSFSTRLPPSSLSLVLSFELEEAEVIEEARRSPCPLIFGLVSAEFGLHAVKEADKEVMLLDVEFRPDSIFDES